VAFSAGGDGGKEPSDICLDNYAGMISRHRRGRLIKYLKLTLGSRLFAFAALLVFGAVTLAWWGFLAWLI
jgi:hypothetical protein